MDFVPPDLDFVPPDFDFVPPDFDFVPAGFDFVPADFEFLPRVLEVGKGRGSAWALRSCRECSHLSRGTAPLPLAFIELRAAGEM